MKTFNVEFGKKAVYQFKADWETVKAKYGCSHDLIKYLKSGMETLEGLSESVDFQTIDGKMVMVITFYAITDPVIVEE